VATTPAPREPADTIQRLEHLRALSEQLPRLGRLVHAIKAQQTAESRDRAALILLYPLVRLGPLRQGALAELVHADPSTVSRHVTSLVEQGLVTRVADETDGRASQLVVTEAGHAQLDQLRRERESQLERITAGWPEADLGLLASLFDRLLEDLTAGLPGFACGPGAPSATSPSTTPPSSITAPREKR
jgi:DNA-binding MarR family transcriptional regulator